MNRSHALLALIIAAAISACGAQTKSDSASKTATAKQAHETPAVAQGTAQMTPGGEIVLTGTTGCGHCNFHKTESCAVGLQTADGHFYIVDGVAENTEVWNDRFAGKKMTMKGTIGAPKDGLDHVQLASYEWVQ